MMFAAFLAASFFVALPLCAQTPTAQDKMLNQVRLEQKLEAQIPLDLPFRNETGQLVHLGDYFGTKPVILALVYYQCPMLCTEVLNGLTRAVRSLSLDAGKDYRIVAVSFNPRETSALAAAKKKVYVERYNRPGAEQGWAFLTGPDSSIHRLADAIGFYYAYDPELDQYAHGTELTVLTPGGRVSHYLYGVEYSAKDLRLAIVDAGGGRIGSPVDQILLYCYHYDPTTGKYGLAIMRIVRIAAIATVIGLALVIGFLLRA